MGVLDDAIREHLDLKRKHGASEGEVEQQEQEALGAPRREPPPQAEAAAAEPAEQVEPTAEPVASDPVEPPPAAVEPEAALPPEEDEPVVEEPSEDEPDWDFGTAPAEPEPPRNGDTPPRGFERVEDDAPPAEGDDEEDVLEETPDFLQETPEHDRLWFEQKPPRDFDFDDDK